MSFCPLVWPSMFFILIDYCLIETNSLISKNKINSTPSYECVFQLSELTTDEKFYLFIQFYHSGFFIHKSSASFFLAVQKDKISQKTSVH